MSFAATNLREYPARKVCRILQIPRSSYYAMRRNGVRRAVAKEELRCAVYDAFVEHHGSFGRRTLKRILERRNIRISEYKISKILKELGFCSKYGRKRCKNVYTSKNTEKYIQENLYASLTDEQKSRMEIWSMDFTEEKIEGKKIYTCGIISVNRKILVGYAQGSRCTTALAMEAFANAMLAYGIPDMVMTDRGAQFVSRDFHAMMEDWGIRHSMSRPRTPVDNRFIETFWKSMKVELGKMDLLNEQTYRIVIEYYIYYYNNLRPHSSLGYLPPLAA
mgnify:FL=1